MNFARRVRRALEKRDGKALAAKVLTRLDDVEYVAELERENKNLSEQARQVQHIDVIRAAAERALETLIERREAREMAARRPDRIDIEALPRDLPEVIDLIERVYPDRLHFLPAARESAKSAAINHSPDATHISWRVLRAMATTLHALFRRRESTDIARRFADETGLELALTESAATRMSRMLRQERVVRLEGCEAISIEPHVKFGNKPPRILRVHFNYLDGEGLIVVGHCGDHLPTAGTRRLRT